MKTTTRNAQQAEAREARAQLLAHLPQEARAQLLAHLQPGDTLYTILRHVARSGMTRHISVIRIHDGEQTDISYLVARVVGCRCNLDDGGVVVGGCGMDMGNHLVYELAARLWPDGHTCTGTRCPSNDHSNGDRNYDPHEHRDGGYALRQRWL